MRELAIIPCAQIPTVWKEARPLLEPAVAHSHGWEIWDVFDRLVAGYADLWVVRNAGKIEACCVAMITEYPAQTVYSLTFIGGSGLRDWLEFETTIADWARARRCVALEGADVRIRQGAWGRTMKNWQPVHTILRREL